MISNLNEQVNHVASSSSTENIEQRNTVARINTPDWRVLVVVVVRNLERSIAHVVRKC